MKTISRQHWTSGQNFNLQEIIQTEDNKLRFTVHTDTYPNQAYARVEVWNGRWHTLHTIPGELMQSPHNLAYQHIPDNRKANFCDADMTELVKVAGAL